MLKITKNILLGVTGGIAAYKSPDLVRRLIERGAQVRVVMTEGALAFVTPLTFQAVSGNNVHTDLLDEEAEAGMGHIELARWADQVVIAPATANFIARLAGGRADDLLSTLCLATEAPVAIAPAMNRVMWDDPATRANCATLARRGVEILGPGTGDQACGETGSGRMLEPTEIASALSEGRLLTGKRVLITAGPTFEAIDPVRFIGNRSSGKMGYALAAAARQQGASVSLVSGPVHLPTPPGIERINVRSAAEMYSAVMQRLESCDIFIGVAAVADYRPASPAAEKIKKNSETLNLSLERTEDILQAVSESEHVPFTVGFAAETGDVEAYARRKLANKKLDMIAANLVGNPGTGFEVDENELLVISPSGRHNIARADKMLVAQQLIQLIAKEHTKNESD